MDWDLILRLVAAGLLGGAIGFEREFRAKEAGIRTHFIVALGSALFMIISQNAFTGHQFDAARVAAQVVSGIGFIGAGVIIFQRNVVRGVTTAAGLWVAAAIGLSCGAKMYTVAVAATALTVVCLEMMHVVHLRYGDKIVDITLASHAEESLLAVLDTLQESGIEIVSYTVNEEKIHVQLRMRQRDYLISLKKLISQLDGFTIEDLS